MSSKKNVDEGIDLKIFQTGPLNAAHEVVSALIWHGKIPLASHGKKYFQVMKLIIARGLARTVPE
jgi:hypothetical protein